jgi:hypothetical protein
VADVPAWLAVATAGITGASALGAEWLRGLHALRSSAADRAAARRRQIEEQRDEFERQTLIALQDAYVALGRQTGRIHIATEEEYREKGTWGRELLPEDLGGEASLFVRREFNRLTQRVLDDDLRALLEQYRSATTDVVTPALREERHEDARRRGNAAWNRMLQLSTEVDAALGAALRRLFGR